MKSFDELERELEKGELSREDSSFPDSFNPDILLHPRRSVLVDEESGEVVLQEVPGGWRFYL